MPNKKICIMTSVHRFDDVRIYHKEAKTLRKAGYDVTVLCSNHVGNETEWVDEVGIKFIKLQLPTERKQRVIHAAGIFYKKARQLDCDYYHFHDPELIPAGLKLRKNAKVIYDIHEDVPRQILTKPYLKPFAAKVSSAVVEWYQNFAAKRFYAVITAEPVIYNCMKNANKNTCLVCNYPRLEEFEITEQDKDVVREKSVCYIGGITEIRGIYEMVRAVEGTDTKLILAGEFETEQLKANVMEEKGYKNVSYLGYIGRNDVKEVLSTVGAGLVTLHPVPKYLSALPVKLFEYMVAGVPVISSNFPYWEAIVKDAKCGLCVDPMQPQEIERAIHYILDNPTIGKKMGESGRKRVIEKYNWGIEQKTLLALYAKE